MFAPGDRIASYVIQRRLGRGGMGEVWLASDPDLDREVALKFLCEEISQDPVARKRFVREARAASSLEHPCICAVHEMGETESGVLYIVMPYYRGRSLSERVKLGPLSLTQVLDLARQLASGLSKAHRAGIIHRDVKAANLLLTEDGVLKIVDFGLAKRTPLLSSSTPCSAAASPRAIDTELTRSGTTLGTVAYMSPEQARGENLDPATDVFSAGVVLYELIAARRPFLGENDYAVVDHILHRPPTSIRVLRPDLPVDLARIVERALDKDRSKRYATAIELAQALQEMQAPHLGVNSGSGDTATTPVASSRTTGFTKRGSRRNSKGATPLILGGSLVVGLGFTGLLGTVWWEGLPTLQTRLYTALFGDVPASSQFDPGDTNSSGFGPQETHEGPIAEEERDPRVSGGEPEIPGAKRDESFDPGASVSRPGVTDGNTTASGGSDEISAVLLELDGDNSAPLEPSGRAVESGGDDAKKIGRPVAVIDADPRIDSPSSDPTDPPRDPNLTDPTTEPLDGHGSSPTDVVSSRSAEPSSAWDISELATVPDIESTDDEVSAVNDESDPLTEGESRPPDTPSSPTIGTVGTTPPRLFDETTFRLELPLARQLGVLLGLPIAPDGTVGRPDHLHGWAPAAILAAIARAAEGLRVEAGRVDGQATAGYLRVAVNCRPDQRCTIRQAGAAGDGALSASAGRDGVPPRGSGPPTRGGAVPRPSPRGQKANRPPRHRQQP